MKQLLNPSNATFNAVAKTITFATTIPSSVSHILHVTNVTQGVLYFQPQAGPLFTGTYASPVITLTCSTTGHSDTDKLEIFYDDGVSSATSTLQSSIITTLGTPLQAGGNVAVTSLPAITGTVTANLGTLNGAATAALQTTGNGSLATIAANIPTVGQKTMANSQPVAIASDQGAIPVSGSVTANLGTLSGAALATGQSTVLAASTASAPTNTAQVVALRDTAMTIQPMVLVPPTVNTLSATGTVQAQIVPGGVYTFCISSSSTLGITANTLASCTTTAGSTTVAYIGTAPSVGQLLAGTGIPTGSYVVSTVGGTNFVMSLPATAAGTNTLNVTAGSFAGNFQSSPDGTTWTSVNVIPMTYAFNAAATNSFVAPGLFRYVSTQKDSFLRFNLTAIGSTGVLGNLSTGPSITFNIDALDRSGGIVNLPYVSYIAATAGTFPSGIPALMPVDMTGMAYASLGIQTISGTGQTITWRQSGDPTGTAFLGLGALSNNAAQNTVSITATNVGEYLLAPSNRYLYAPMSGSAVTANTITGYVAHVGVSNAATQTVNTIASQVVLGNVAHSSASSGNPLRVGGRVITTLDTTLSQGDVSDAAFTTGQQLVTKDFASSENDWQFATATGGIVNTTTAVTIKAAGAASIRNYITGLTIASDALGAATELVIRDGAAGTVIYRTKLQTASMGTISIVFPTPLRGTAATLMEVAALTATITGGVYVNVQGYQGF